MLTVTQEPFFFLFVPIYAGCWGEEEKKKKAESFLVMATFGISVSFSNDLEYQPVAQSSYLLWSLTTDSYLLGVGS